MKLFRRPVPASRVVNASVDPQPHATLTWEFGDQYCSFRGCIQKTGLACSYIDRRERPCPTAWCPQHRYVTHGAVFCKSHGHFLDGTADEFGETVRIDLENQIPSVMAWIVQEIDSEISMAMLGVAMDWHQALVLDPVHFVLIGVQRVRTWERAWKVCEHLGVTLRVAVAIEESDPSTVEARINSRPAVRLAVPWHEDHGFGTPPATIDEARAEALEFRQRLLSCLIKGIAEWREGNLDNRGPYAAPGSTLRGYAQPGFSDSTPQVIPRG